MRPTQLIDYAAPMLDLEKMLKDLHNLLLENKFDEGLELSMMIAAEARLLTRILQLMKEKQR